MSNSAPSSSKMSLKKPVRGLRALAANLPVKVPWKVPLTPRSKAIVAAVTLVLVWVIGPHTGFQHTTDDELLISESSTSVVEDVRTIPLVKSRPKEKEAIRIPAASDQLLNYEDAEKFCSHHHLEPHNISAPVGSEDPAQHATTPRRIYDLLLITPVTSAASIELHLASMYPYVEYFIMLEAPIMNNKASPAPSRDSLEDTLPTEEPSLVDKMWKKELSAYHNKIIRHSLSEHSMDFKEGLDHGSTTRNAFHTRVIPLLTGKQRVEPGDVLLVSDAEELVRPITMKVLRNCNIPERTTIRTRKYWYSYQYMKVVREGAQPPTIDAGNEWWPHPQATVYTGPDTLLPDDLRKQRDQDQYVFGDGGWMCYLCDSTITETLAKLNSSGVIWTDGPRWKAAARVVDKVMKGIDLIEHSNLSRIESNPDLPPYIQANKARFHWMIDRDGPGAKFFDFDANDLDRYRAKQETLDAEPDFERGESGVSYTLENTQQPETPPPAPQTDWRSTALAGFEGTPEEERQLMQDIRERVSKINSEGVQGPAQ